MLTHVHKVIHLVVSTFEQCLRRWRSRGSVSYWKTLTRRWSRCDQMLTLASGQCWLVARRRRWSDRMLGASGHVVTIFAQKTLTRLNWTLGWPRPVISLDAFGHDFDCALTNFATVEDQRAVFERGHVAPIRGLGAQRPDTEATSGRPEVGTLLSLTSLGTLINSWWPALGDLS
jgi:hypothetical protein